MDKQPNTSEEIDALIVMEQILDKLKTLDYEAQFTRIK